MNLPTRLPRLTESRRGFTFLEVLFAVILLGIGIIMIAGMFPVAIIQTTATANETQGAVIGKSALRELQTLGMQAGAYPFISGQSPAAITLTSTYDAPTVLPSYNIYPAYNGATLFPPTTTGGVPCVQSVVTTLPPLSLPSTPPTAAAAPLGAAIGDNFLLSSDQRYAWTAFYRRDSASAPYAQVFILTLYNPNFPNYIQSGGVGMPQPVLVAGISASNSTPQTITIPGAGSSNGATVGAFVIISSCTQTGTLPMPGRILRLGQDMGPGSGGESFAVDPNYPLINSGTPASSDATTGISAYIVGMAPTNSNGATSGGFSGPNQDLTVITSYIPINTTAN